MTDFHALTWIMEPINPPIDEPRLPYAANERLTVGQCREDGAILSSNGGPFVRRGRIWLDAGHRDEAAYYGWKDTGIVAEQDDRPTLYLVER